MTLTITHSHEEGTLIEGTAKGDGSGEVLKRYRWRWGRSIGSWYVPRSRDAAADRRRISATVEALERAGFTVAVEIDDTARPAAQVEADRAERLEARAEALQAKAQRKEAGAEAAYAAHRDAADRMPEGGEPVKLDHYSGKAHQRAIDRAHSTMGKALEADREAERAAHRTKVAERANEARYAPSTVSNRINRLEADARRINRHLQGYTAQPGTPYAEEIPPATGTARERWQADADRVADELEYWRGVRAEQVASGAVIERSREDVAAGDFVKVGRSGTWWQIKRANPKTVTLESHGCSIKAPYGSITDHRSAEQIEAAQGQSRAVNNAGEARPPGGETMTCPLPGGGGQLLEFP